VDVTPLSADPRVGIHRVAVAKWCDAQPQMEHELTVEHANGTPTAANSRVRRVAMRVPGVGPGAVRGALDEHHTSTQRSKAPANRSASPGARLTGCEGSPTSAGYVENVSRVVAAQLKPRQGSAVFLSDFGLGRRAECADGLSHGRMNSHEPRVWLFVRRACAERSAAAWGAGAAGSERIDACHSAFLDAAAFAFAAAQVRKRVRDQWARIGA
jgi:hypothetical protein